LEDGVAGLRAIFSRDVIAAIPMVFEIGALFREDLSVRSGKEVTIPKRSDRPSFS
jgi:hypothetical protein